MIYRLKAPTGGTAKLFKSLTSAYRYLKPDCPDLVPRDLYRKDKVSFADGYQLVRSYK